MDAAPKLGEHQHHAWAAAGARAAAYTRWRRPVRGWRRTAGGGRRAGSTPRRPGPERRPRAPAEGGAAQRVGGGRGTECPAAPGERGGEEERE